MSEVQKAEVIRWGGTGRNHAGRDIHWTLEKLRQSIEDEFGIRMGINTLWVFIRKEGYSFKKASAKHIQGDAEAQEQFKKTAELSKKNLISASCILIKADLGFIRTKEKAGSPIQEDRGFFY